ncbi:hypothetical protein [Streptomyces sp. NPDC001108]
MTVQLHDGGDTYPVIPVPRHSEISYYFDARCVGCRVKYEEPFARVDEQGEILDDQMRGLPMVDWMWFGKQCGPFTCGCDQDQLDPAATPE